MSPIEVIGQEVFESLAREAAGGEIDFYDRTGFYMGMEGWSSRQ